MANVLSEVRSTVEKRLRELEPLVQEHAQLRAALSALERTAGRERPVATSGPKRQRVAAAGSGAKRRGRPRGSGARAEQVVGLVRSEPGITIAELAKRMKIKPNYLYRVVPQLEKAGQLAKRGKGYHPPES
jgi:hypothetical protein